MFRAHLAAAVVLGLALGACRGGEEETQRSPVPDTPAETGMGGSDAPDNPAEGGNDQNHTVPTNEASLITWNLESYPLTPEAEEKAIALLEDLAPDVVALQEIADEDAFYTLVDRLEGYDGVLNDDPGAWLRVGLLWRTDRVTVTDAETLFTSDWYAFPRPPLKAHVTIDAPTPIDFVTVVLHLKAQLNTESEERRRTACERLEAWVSEQIVDADEQDYVLIGDLNDKLTDPPQWNVFGAFLDKPDAYTFLTMPAAQNGEHTYLPFESFIDHVLVTSDTLDEITSSSPAPRWTPSPR